MSTAAAEAAGAPGWSDPAAVVVVAECAGEAGAHLMVAVSFDPVGAGSLRAVVTDLLDRDGLWCGPGAASPRCRTGLAQAAVSGGVAAVVVDAVGFDDAGQARAACLRAVVTEAEELGVDRLLVARDDACAGRDSGGAAELARLAGASPALRCAHADTGTEPLTAVAEILAWSWAQGGAQRRSVGAVLRAVHLV